MESGGGPFVPVCLVINASVVRSFSKVFEAPAPGEVKLEPLVDDPCLDDEVRTVLLRKVSTGGWQWVYN